MKNIYVFTLLKCRWCNELKEKLTAESIPFQEVIVEYNREIWNKVKEQVGGPCHLPSVFIQDRPDGGGTAYMPGRDFHSIDDLVQIVKNTII